MKSPKLMSQAELEDLVLKWQKILRLEDWDVAISWKAKDILKNPESIAQNHYRSESKTSSIFLNKDKFENQLPSVTTVNGKIFQYDVEDTIIHELLHLHFTFIDSLGGGMGKLASILLEQSIEAIGPALYQLGKEK